jgi:5'-3' exonuclease
MKKMVINNIYVKYFQKSKIFIYPLLNIKRGSSIVPVETFVSWDNKYSPNDAKLICLYDNKEDAEYKNFVKNVLLKHARLCDHRIYYDQSVFVFDFQDMKDDWNYFKRGKYSQMKKKTKDEILNFFERYSGNYIYINSFLYPENWFARYAEILSVEKRLLVEVGELCNIPNPDLEHLTIN